MKDERVTVQPEDTTMRWFGPVRPGHHSMRSRVPTPTKERCTVCGVFFKQGDQGWTLPHLSVPVETRSYHHVCLFEALGLAKPEEAT